MQAATHFGPMLRSLRQFAQLSQQRLAEQAEVSTRQLLSCVNRLFGVWRRL